FFSSRRRHTRFSRDWSSDVCSSDLLLLFSNALMLGSIRGNGIRIHERQFPDVYESVQTLSKEMGLKAVPDVFVIQSEGALNAFEIGRASCRERVKMCVVGGALSRET